MCIRDSAVPLLLLDPDPVGGLLTADDLLGDRRAAIRQLGFVAEEEDLAGEARRAQGASRADAGDAGADDDGAPGHRHQAVITSTMVKSAFAAPQSGHVQSSEISSPVSYTHLRAHETVLDLVCRL